MPIRTVTLTASTIGNDVGPVDIYHTSVTAANLITASISTASLEAGFEFTTDSTNYTFLCTLGSACGTTSSIALTDAPVGSWSAVGNAGPESASIETIGGEVISASLSDITWNGSNTYMVVNNDPDLRWVLTSVDAGLTWLKETGTHAPAHDIAYITASNGEFWVGSSTYESSNNRTTMAYSTNNGSDWPSATVNANLNSSNRSCFYTNLEGSPTSIPLSIAHKPLSGQQTQWHTYTTACCSYTHTYVCSRHGSSWGTNPSTGNLCCGVPGSPVAINYVTEPPRYLTGGGAGPQPAPTLRYINSYYGTRFLKQCEIDPTVRPIGAIHNITGSLCACNDLVLIGACGGNAYKATVNSSSFGLGWSHLDSGTTTTNFTITAVAGDSGSADDPRIDFVAFTKNTDETLGTVITSSDGGDSWAAYTAGGLGSGVVNYAFNDGRRYIGVGASGSKGKLIQSRDNRINVDWLEATVCHPLNSALRGNGVYLAVGDSGSIVRGV